MKKLFSMIIVLSTIAFVVSCGGNEPGGLTRKAFTINTVSFDKTTGVGAGVASAMGTTTEFLAAFNTAAKATTDAGYGTDATVEVLPAVTGAAFIADKLYTYTVKVGNDETTYTVTPTDDVLDPNEILNSTINLVLATLNTPGITDVASFTDITVTGAKDSTSLVTLDGAAKTVAPDDLKARVELRLKALNAPAMIDFNGSSVAVGAIVGGANVANTVELTITLKAKAGKKFESGANTEEIKVLLTSAVGKFE